ncbi:hypothetical protein NDU88_003050 [Pleurodeles waltl]|uniref:Uncharacterized protein n=1 Tax=Pleurodeles waltl TaxID=8319 RepID=A0AAV7NI44_PLEWA|nr:hypothetical protein NDU88_003050 [Pleurodeles waltl]
MTTFEALRVKFDLPRALLYGSLTASIRRHWQEELREPPTQTTCTYLVTSADTPALPPEDRMDLEGDVAIAEVQAATSRIKPGKTSGPNVLLAEMFKPYVGGCVQDGDLVAAPFWSSAVRHQRECCQWGRAESLYYLSDSLAVDHTDVLSPGVGLLPLREVALRQPSAKRRSLQRYLGPTY